MAHGGKPMRPHSTPDDEDWWNESKFSRNQKLFGDDDFTDLRRELVSENSGWPSLDDEVERNATEQPAESVSFTGSGFTYRAPEPRIESARSRPEAVKLSQTITPTLSAESLNMSPVVTDIKTHRRTGSSISDVVSSTIKEPSRAEISKLEAEINRLKHRLKKEQSGEVSIGETIKRMLLGQPYVLERYKSLKEKEVLLKQALKTHDGNAINAVVSFLNRTLSSSNFMSLLKLIGGLEQYVNMLREENKLIEAEDYLALNNSPDEAAMTRYRYAMKTANVSSRVKQIEACYNQHFSLGALESDKRFLQYQLSLLRIQQAVQDSDAKSRETNPILKKYNPKKPLVESPALQTLFYGCFYHYNEAESNYASPKYITSTYQLSPKQYQWVITRALSLLKHWQQLKNIYERKNWRGKAIMESEIGFENVVAILHKTNATPDIMNEYCALVNPSDDRLRTAYKYDCGMVVVDTLIYQKDKSQLLDYQRKLKSGTAEMNRLMAALDNSKISWKS